MRVFIFESVTGGDFLTDAAARPESLLQEGLAMVSAVAQDFQALPECQVSLLWDHRLARPRELDRCAVFELRSHHELESRVRSELQQSDICLLIAPELDGRLLALTRLAESVAAHSLGPSAAFVALAADKLRLADHLSERSIPTPLTLPADSVESIHSLAGRDCVLKRRDGAGSIEMRRLVPSATTEHSFQPNEPWVIQPYHRGIPVSVAILCIGSRLVPLPACRQWISDDGSFRYLGGSVPVDPQWNHRAQRLAIAAVQSIPGGKGYVGVDLLLDPEGEESRDLVIDINPRLTTSYVGLRHVVRQNLARLMMNAPSEEELPLDLADHGVEFSATGSIARVDVDGTMAGTGHWGRESQSG